MQGNNVAIAGGRQGHEAEVDEIAPQWRSHHEAAEDL
jgi:hypothetical protein